MKNNSFRYDINGLRAIAVIAVVIFHFNASWLPGGFAGVDVFFVISGFLMTGIIFRGIEQQNFSTLKFYLARVNRIIPALTILCLVLLIFGWFFLAPLEYKALGKHAFGSVTFLSNIIYLTESGYFDTSSHEKWLLHTWSLSVEWQFYIIYPVVLVLLKKIFTIESIKKLLVVCTIVGFLGCIYATYEWAGASYFLLPTRAWEMMVGGIAFLYPFRCSENLKKVTEWLGLILIFSSYFFISSENLWPGYLAIFPVLGTFLLIQANRQNSFVTNNPFSQKIGTWSYSIYLWHWPIVVYIYYFDLNIIYTYVGILISLVLGYLSYQYIEKENSINKIIKSNYRKIILLSIFAVASLLFLLNSRPYNQGIIDEKVLNTISMGKYDCFNKVGQHQAENNFCTLTNGSNKVFAFGDSHNFAMLPALEKIARKNDLELQYTGYNGCVPLIGVYSDRRDQVEKNCHELNNKVYKHIRDGNFNSIILTARWAYYTEGDYSGATMQHIYHSGNTEISRKNSQETFRLGLKKTLQEYNNLNIKIYLMLQVPHQIREPYNILYRSIVNENLDDQEINIKSVSIQKHKELQKNANEIILEEVEKFDNVTVIDPTPWLCNSTNCPIGNTEGSYYYDDDHLSISGSLKLINLIEEAMLTQ